jgi:hypothetical protein
MPQLEAAGEQTRRQKQISTRGGSGAGEKEEQQRAASESVVLKEGSTRWSSGASAGGRKASTRGCRRAGEGEDWEQSMASALERIFGGDNASQRVVAWLRAPDSWCPQRGRDLKAKVEVAFH